MPRFAKGDRVRVLDIGKPGHVRIPVYARHKAGVVERWCGAYPNPEDLAYARSGLPAVDLFRVRFRQVDLWDAYASAASDCLELEVYDHWLASAEGGSA